MRRHLALLVTAFAVACGGPTEPVGTASSAGAGGGAGASGASGASAGAAGMGGSTAAGSGAVSGGAGASGSATAGTSGAAGSMSAGAAGTSTGGASTAGVGGTTTAGAAGTATAGAAGTSAAGTAGSSTAGTSAAGAGGSSAAGSAGTSGSSTAGAAGSGVAGGAGAAGVTFLELTGPADWTSIEATGIDGTGQYVIAYCNTPQGSRGCLWDGASWTILGDKGWSPRGVSLGGGVVVGDKYYWSDPTGLVTIGDALSIGAVSDDGNWVAGMHASGGTMAFRWSMASDMEDLGDLAGGGVQSEAYGISADGSTACGYSVATAGSFAFIWTKVGGMISMGDLLGGSNQSYCLAINPLGDVAIGWSSSGKGNEAFRWSKAGGMTALGVPGGAGWKNSRAGALSADGNVIVGYTDTGFGDESAVVWTPSGKMQLLDAYLTGLGVDLTGWQMKRAVGVSHDGKSIVGWGFTGAGQRSFLVKLQ